MRSKSAMAMPRLGYHVPRAPARRAGLSRGFFGDHFSSVNKAQPDLLSLDCRFGQNHGHIGSFAAACRSRVPSTVQDSE